MKGVLWVLGLLVASVCGQTEEEKNEFKQTFKDIIVENDLKEE